MLQSVAQSPDGPDRLPLPHPGAFFQIELFLFRGYTREQCLPAGQGRQHQRTVMSNELLGQPLHIHRLLAQLSQLCQCRSGILRFQRIRNMEQIAPVSHACHPADNVRIDLCRDTGTGIQNGQRVSHGTIGKAGDELRPLAGQLQSLLPGDVLHTLGDILGADAGKIVPLAPGKDGGGDLLDLRGRQNKDDVGGRLLQRFQQGIERCRGEHVHLVDDIYLIMTGAGGVGRFITQITDIVHAVVGGRVHLHHVQNAAVVDASADLALTAGVTVLGMQAVDCLGKDLGTGGLAGAAHAGKQISVAHTACGDLVAQCGHDAALGHHILKPLGPPLAVQGSIHLLLPFQQKSRAALTGVDPRLA